MKDSIVYDGLTCTFNQYHMGITVENLSDRYNLSRKAQDVLAAESQDKANKAINSRRFKEEIVPVEILQQKTPSFLILMNIQERT